MSTPEERFDAWVKTFRTELSDAEARFAAECFLALPIPEREQNARELFMDSPETLIPLLEILRGRLETAPAAVRVDAEHLYLFLEKVKPHLGIFPKVGKFVFDEREFLMADAALIAGAACRDLSLRAEAVRWFNRAEALFFLTAEPTAELSRLWYERLALMTEERRFDEVLEILPALIESFGRVELPEEVLKCRSLEGQILKETGRLREAVEVFRNIRDLARDYGREKLLGSTYVNLIQLYAELGEAAEALSVSQEAIPLLKGLDNRTDLAKAYWGIGMLYRRQGNLPAAIETFRAAQKEFLDLSMRADAAALHLIIADLLLEGGQDAQARWEIQAALPDIDEYQLVPEGVAALSLLRQSLANHRINRQALRDLHGYFPES